jgi:hypothetical protein
MNVPRNQSLMKWTILAVLLLFLPNTVAAQSSCQACLVVLDPHSSHAFTAGNGAHVTLNSCGIRVNSDSAAAFYETGGAVVTSSATQVVGGYSIVNGASATPVPQSGAAAGNDPFAGVPAPQSGVAPPTRITPRGARTATTRFTREHIAEGSRYPMASRLTSIRECM